MFIDRNFAEISQDDHELPKLLSYLDDQLSVLSDNLYPELFKNVLKFLWTAIVKDLRSLIFPDRNVGALMTLQEAKKLVNVLKVNYTSEFYLELISILFSRNFACFHCDKKWD